MITYLTLPNIILAIFLFIIFLLLILLYKRNEDEHDVWEWKQLISEPNGKASQTKVMQLIGSITGTFIVIYQTLKDSLISEVFIAYLTALGLSAGFSKWMRYQNKNNNDFRPDDRPDDRPDGRPDISEEEIEEFKHKNRNI